MKRGDRVASPWDEGVAGTVIRVRGDYVHVRWDDGTESVKLHRSMIHAL